MVLRPLLMRKTRLTRALDLCSVHRSTLAAEDLFVCYFLDIFSLFTDSALYYCIAFHVVQLDP